MCLLFPQDKRAKATGHCHIGGIDVPFDREKQSKLNYLIQSEPTSHKGLEKL
jgi:hypothetical protein